MISIRALREKTAWRETAPSIFLVLNTFVWYIFTYAVFYAIVNGLNLLETEKLGLFIAYYVGVAVSALLGSKFFPRARSKALGLWLVMWPYTTLHLTRNPRERVIGRPSSAFFLGAS